MPMYEPTLEDYAANLKNDDPDVRRNAAWTLGRMRDERIVPPLIAALNDSDSTVRVRAVEALGNYRDARAVEPLMALLDGEMDAEVRTRVVTSLGRQGDNRANTTVIGAMRDVEASVRVAAAEALAALGGKGAVAALAEALSGDSDPDVRYQAGRGLSALGGDAVAARLIDALNAAQPPDDDATLRILEILGQLQFVKHPGLGDTIKRYFDHTDEAIAETARWAYGRLSQ